MRKCCVRFELCLQQQTPGEPDVVQEKSEQDLLVHEEPIFAVQSPSHLDRGDVLHPHLALVFKSLLFGASLELLSESIEKRERGTSQDQTHTRLLSLVLRVYLYCRRDDIFCDRRCSRSVSTDHSPPPPSGIPPSLIVR